MSDKIGPFILGKKLGAGQEGIVRLGIHEKTNKKVAIKIIDKEHIVRKPGFLRKVEREIAVMKLINHPNVIRLYEVKQDSKRLYLITELAERGELFDYIVRKGKMNPDEVFRIFRQIINGLEYCHSQLICHRDLKPENLLLDKNYNIKIADFGMANIMSNDKLLETSCGSPHYASPEVIKGKKYDGMQADVWSCGVILYALSTGRLPFDDDNLQCLLKKVETGIFEFPMGLKDEDLKDLIRKMLTVDPSKRITVKKIKKHPWWIKNLPKEEVEENSIKEEEKEEKDEDEDCTITNIDEDIIKKMVDMGWKDVTKLKEKLESKNKNMETVLYRLLQKRKEDGVADDSYELSNSDSMSVSPSQPITSIVDPSELLKQRLKHMVEEEKKGQKEEKQPWFAFWKKKNSLFKRLSFGKSVKPVSTTSFGLQSKKSLHEILKELTHVFQTLHIKWEKIDEQTIRATCAENDDPVEFDISLKFVQETNCFILEFKLVNGNERTARILFDILQQELEL